jgi:hypothetical protein
MELYLYPLCMPSKHEQGLLYLFHVSIIPFQIIYYRRHVILAIKTNTYLSFLSLEGLSPTPLSVCYGNPLDRRLFESDNRSVQQITIERPIHRSPARSLVKAKARTVSRRDDLREKIRNRDIPNTKQKC